MRKSKICPLLYKLFTANRKKEKGLESYEYTLVLRWGRLYRVVIVSHSYFSAPFLRERIEGHEWLMMPT